MLMLLFAENGVTNRKSLFFLPAKHILIHYKNMIEPIKPNKPKRLLVYWEFRSNHLKKS